MSFLKSKNTIKVIYPKRLNNIIIKKQPEFNKVNPLSIYNTVINILYKLY